ncbi:hypothetical protein R8871_02570 [Paraburkholderia graminis C4D1M]|uniref:YkgJ family cysteine cluster protein n=1 Tax=Paraburkholderia graminis (strain ATCC 700544 / DSM 17151 / LMG 18924 / NCIMB 13744 / C4D1M) TaxID=396598 RepID=B1G965_PARG4|nr:YkgJ family cysteine cluster protein [Paraburkholderia graminis]EDT07326.1 protein of unknown function UPF0153 [Paraburkholderia graminis C4D1M]CAB3682118.1 hypothetical protein R8871_02570 [Paraburkholderia graminis C4D1M]
MATLTESEAQHDEQVVTRWRELESGKLARVIGIVNEQALSIKQRHHHRVNAVINSSGMTIYAKIEALWEAVDELGAVAKPHAACRKGCSHCCHTSVLMPEQEAALIGRRIGVKPRTVTGLTRRGDVAAGYGNPCPFLKGDACSIYSSRPLACRQQFNMDSDALLCELIGGPSKVPYLNLMDYQTALAMVTTSQRDCIGRDPSSGRPVPLTVTTAPAVGDIRQFFPKGRP